MCLSLVVKVQNPRQWWCREWSVVRRVETEEPPPPPDRLPVTVAADSSVKDSCLWQHEGWSGRRTSLQSVSVCQCVNVTGRGARRGRGGVSASWSELIGANVRLQDERWRLSVETLNAVSVIITCTD